MSRYVIPLLLAGCIEHPDPGVEIVRPADGTMITTSPSIVIDFRVRGLSTGATDLYVDRMPVPRTQLIGSCPAVGDTGMLIWTPSAIENGPHEIELACVDDVVEYTDTITLVFARP